MSNYKAIFLKEITFYDIKVSNPNFIKKEWGKFKLIHKVFSRLIYINNQKSFSVQCCESTRKLIFHRNDMKIRKL